jgi:hypothetical protein
MLVYNFSMRLSAAKCKQYYQGHFRNLVVTCDNGQTVQLPADRFRPFMTTNGVSGRFRLLLDDENKFIALEKAY